MSDSPPTAHTILIVDDSRTQLEMLRFLLEEENYHVVTALNGQAALEVAQQQPPDLIISDIVMPVMDGYALCRALKQDPVLCRVPVMLLTTLSDTEDVIAGLNAQADYYLTKPYDGDYLLAQVATIFQEQSDSDCNATAEAQPTLDITIGNKNYSVSANRRQMLSLILSTYEHAFQRHRELQRTQAELQGLHEKLLQNHQQLQEANRQLETLATVDGLTGLKNHRAFQESLEAEFQRTKRYGTPLSLLLLDVDHFKQFNDTFGHPAGDEVLKQVSQLIEQAARVTDFPARYGGEEFAVILPNTPHSGALLAGERVRAAIASPSWPLRSVTTSIGVATVRPDDPDRAAAIARADAALYVAKKAGRNQVASGENVE